MTKSELKRILFETPKYEVVKKSFENKKTENHGKSDREMRKMSLQK